MTDALTTIATAGEVELAGKKVFRMAFGAMHLGDPMIWGPPADRDHSIRLARHAIELGVNHFDTADSYGLGTVENILREALHPYPEELLIATKVGQVQPRPLEWVPIGHPAFLRHQCEMSLRRLGVDRIDLLYLHRADPNVPFEDQVGTMRELQEEGKIAHFGLSEVTVDQIETARSIIEVAAVENIYNLTVRGWNAVVDYCTRERIPFMPWWPVMNGALAQPGGIVAEIAAQTGSSPTQVALAWLLARSEMVCPIPGTSSTAHLEENVAAAALRLTDEQITALTAAGGSDGEFTGPYI
ncbi:aldo/keto reductase [Nocardia brasiliensis]|uniref:aldo/keto reductase n=1 Tax=Nocardia brasiliensis TaxID=37326 RepID=UPI0018934208|nr:aldo/keto reductase [Nocardia brasiliensis]MBF6128805.1 aldo/keto reductase [Nocardia brasiliensis]